MKIIKEPLLHFILIGAVLFLLYGWRGRAVPADVTGIGMSTAPVTVTPDDIQQLNSQFAKTWQRPATEDEQKKLIENFIRNEIFYREAIAIGLDRDDAVLKRRLRQKMEFIYENISDLAEPTDADLQGFMASHREKYISDHQVGFRQVFVNVHQRGAEATSHARELLARLAAGADPNALGDVTLLDAQMPLSPLRDIASQFGDDFSQHLLNTTPGTWTGPVTSAYGLHLLLVTERVGPRLPDLEEVREVIRRDWMFAQQQRLKDAAYAKLLQRYTVIVERPDADPSPLVDAALKKGTVP